MVPARGFRVGKCVPSSAGFRMKRNGGLCTVRWLGSSLMLPGSRSEGMGEVMVAAAGCAAAPAAVCRLNDIELGAEKLEASNSGGTGGHEHSGTRG